MEILKRWLGVLGALTGTVGFFLMGLEKLVILAGIMIVVGWLTFAFMTKSSKEKFFIEKKSS